MNDKYSIVFYGKTPSKKNSLARVFAKGRTLTIPGKFYQQWEKDQLKSLGVVLPVPFPPPYKVKVVIYAGDKRKGDLSNKVESINDLLVKVGIIPDDNWFELSTLIVRFGGVDKANPRAEVEITPDEISSEVAA